MEGTFRIIDRDTGAIRLDLNALGNTFDAPNPYGFGLLGDLDMGAVQAETEWIEGTSSTVGHSGDYPVKTRHPNVEMRFRLWALAATYEDLADMVESLGTELNREGTIEWQPAGGDKRFIDFFPSPLPSLFHGNERGINKVVELLIEEGLPVTVIRHPYLRGEVLDAVEQIARNGVVNRAVIVDNPGNVTGLAKVTIEPREAAARVVEAKIGRRTEGNLTEFETIHAFQCEDTTNMIYYNNTVVQAGITEASGNSVMRTNFTAFTGLARRWRKRLQPVDASTLRGRFKVFAVVKVTNAGVYRLQMRWGAGNPNPANMLGTLEPIRLDFSDVENFHFVEVDLGVIELTNGGDCVIEGWAGRGAIDDDDTADNGDPISAGDLDWDMVYLMPMDETNGTVMVPGHRRGGSNTTRYLGRELKDYGAIDPDALPERYNDDIVLNNEEDWAATPGQQLDTGRHKVTVRVSIRNKRRKAQLIGYLKVTGTGDRNAVNDGEGLVRIPLRTKKKLWTHRRKTVIFEVGGTGLSAGTPYRFMVELTNKPVDSDARIVVQVLTHRFHRYSAPGAPIELDANTRRAQLYEGVNPVVPLSLDGSFIYLAPGQNLLTFSFGDLPGPGYDDVDGRDSLSRTKPDRTADVTIVTTPRYSG